MSHRLFLFRLAMCFIGGIGYIHAEGIESQTVVGYGTPRKQPTMEEVIMEGMSPEPPKLILAPPELSDEDKEKAEKEKNWLYYGIREQEELKDRATKEESDAYQRLSKSANSDASSNPNLKTSFSTPAELKSASGSGSKPMTQAERDDIYNKDDRWKYKADDSWQYRPVINPYSSLLVKDTGFGKKREKTTSESAYKGFGIELNSDLSKTGSTAVKPSDSPSYGPSRKDPLSVSTAGPQWGMASDLMGKSSSANSPANASSFSSPAASFAAPQLTLAPQALLAPHAPQISAPKLTINPPLTKNEAIKPASPAPVSTFKMTGPSRLKSPTELFGQD
jgi:hypothetical protein